MPAPNTAAEIGREGLLERCGNCVFGHPMRDPGIAPTIPPAPSRDGFWGWLLGGEDIFDQLRRTRPLRQWQTQKERFDNLVICKCFPEAVEKSKASICGEYAPAAALKARAVGEQSPCT